MDYLEYMFSNINLTNTGTVHRMSSNSPYHPFLFFPQYFSSVSDFSGWLPKSFDYSLPLVMEWAWMMQIIHLVQLEKLHVHFFLYFWVLQSFRLKQSDTINGPRWSHSTLFSQLHKWCWGSKIWICVVKKDFWFFNSSQEITLLMNEMRV